MNLKAELKRLSNYVVYAKVKVIDHQTATSLNILGMVTSGDDDKDRRMMNDTQTVRVSILKLAEYYKNGIGFDLSDPMDDVVPIYELIVGYLTLVGQYLGSPGFRSLTAAAREGYQNLILKDAFTLEYLADGLYPLVDSYDLENKVKNKKKTVLDIFREHIQTGIEYNSNKILDEHNSEYDDIENSAHRVALRTNLPKQLIYKYEDMLELNL